MKYDIAVIGAGPAGVSAVLCAKSLDKSFIWLSAEIGSKKVERAELINNYPGLPAISGKALSEAFINHAESVGAQVTQKVVTNIFPTGDGFALISGSDFYEARTVILCLGVASSKSVEGEEQFLGRGISYCATCDGGLYRGKTLAVYCADKRYEAEAEFLCKLAKKAYIIPMYKGCNIKADNAEIILKQPIEYKGGERLEKVVFSDSELAVDGVFILKNSFAPTTLLKGLEVDGWHIKVERDMSTNIAGVFAAGDCTGRPYQYSKAVGEGNIAVHSAVEYLNRLQ